MHTAKTQFSQWTNALSGHLDNGQLDPNSISCVLYDLFWEMAIYEAYMAICQSNPTSILATPIFAQSTIPNYLYMQALRIRRLTEINSQTISKKDTSVYSLINILNDMKQLRYSGELTADYICTAYDITPLSKVFKGTKIQFTGAPTIEDVHAANHYCMLAKICDKHGIINKLLLNTLEKKLLVDKNITLGSVTTYVNKYIAHSSSASSRRSANKELALRIDAIKHAIQDVTETYYALNILITQSDVTTLIPTGWETVLNNLSSDQANIVQKAFAEAESNCETWKKNGYALILPDA